MPSLSTLSSLQISSLDMQLIHMEEKSQMLYSLQALVNSLYLHPLSFFPFFVFLFLLFKWVYTKSAPNKKLPPSPRKLPILGNLLQLGRYPHRSLQALAKQYGEMMLIHFGQTPALIVSSASVAKEIMKTHDAVFSNRPKSTVGDKLLYNSRDVAAAPYGEYWRQMKSLFVLQLLSNKRVRSYRVVREEETALLVEKIKKTTSVVNLSEMFTVFTNDVTCRVAFGRKYSGDQQGDVDFKESLKEFMELLGGTNIGDFIPWLAWINRFNGLNARLDKVAKKFDMLIEEILNQHMENPTEIGDGSKTKDFVDVLLEVQRDNTAGFPVERDSIKALILDVFSAGTHTTSTVLEWAMTELLRNPRIMTKLQKEVRGISRSKENITEDDLEQISYLKAVIKETMRLHLPIPLLVPRESTQDVKINGYDIAAKTMVIINAWAIQRDPMIWEDPEEFRPERFLDSSVDFKGQDCQLIPFGSGRRICPGISFAISNNELVLANLVDRFNWSLPVEVTPETLDMSESIGLTIHRKIPLLASATPHINQ